MNNNLVIENAKIAFRNFEGLAGKYNKEGDRNFCVLLDSEFAEEIKGDGWNIKYLKPKEEDDTPVPFLKINVKFGKIPPKVVLISGKGKTILEEESISILDWAEIESVDLIVRPYNWEMNGKTGTTAYLKAIYVTIVEDEFERKYYDVPDSAANSIGIEHEH